MLCCINIGTLWLFLVWTHMRFIVSKPIWTQNWFLFLFISIQFFPKIYLPEKLGEINLDNFWSSSTAVAIVGQRVFALFIYFCSSCSAFLCSSCSAFLCACYAWPTAPNCFPLQRCSQTFSFVSIWHPPLWQPTCFYLAHPSWDVLGCFGTDFFLARFSQN